MEYETRFRRLYGGCMVLLGLMALALATAFGTGLSDERLQRVRERQPASYGELLAAAPGTGVVVEGRIARSNPVLMRDFVAYHSEARHRVRRTGIGQTDQWRDQWPITQTHRQALDIDLPGGTVRVGNDDYQIHSPPGTWKESEALRHAGFRAGQAVMVLGTVEGGKDRRALRAEVLYGGSRSDFIAHHEPTDRVFQVMAVVLALAGVGLAGGGLRKIVVPVAPAPAPTPPSGAVLAPAGFGDPLAVSVGWNPAQFATLEGRWRKRIVEAAGLVVLQSGAAALLLGGLLLAFGLAMLAFGWHGLATLQANPAGDDGQAMLAIGAFHGVIGTLLGILLLRGARSRHIFDRRAGLYWKGGTAPASPDDRTSCRLQSIHAVQLLRKPAGRNRGDAFELNLVLKDGRRIGVLDVRDLAHARDCAARVAALVGCKTWDGTNPAFQAPAAASVLPARLKPIAIALGIVVAVAALAAAIFGPGGENRSTEEMVREEEARLQARSREIAERSARRDAAAVAATRAPRDPDATRPQLAMTGTGAPPPGMNVFREPSFEGRVPREWRLGDGADASSALTRQRARTGRQSLAVRGTQMPTPGWVSGRYPVAPRTPYEFSVAAQSVDGAEAWPGAFFYDAAGTQIGQFACPCGAGMTPRAGWRTWRFTFDDSVAEGLAAIEFTLGMCLPAPATTPKTVLFDDVSFQRLQRLPQVACLAD